MAEVEPEENAQISAETVGQMKQRHKKELKALAQNAKSQLHSYSKTDKKAKKDAQKEIAEREKQLHAQQATELSELQHAMSVSSIVDSQEEMKYSHIEQSNRAQTYVSKSQKRRNKKKNAEKARYVAACNTVSNKEDSKQTENAAIDQALVPLQLKVKEILSDGHCLYRAIGDQLALNGHPASMCNHESLRCLTCSHMKSHIDNHLPFLTNNNGDLMNPTEYEDYCNAICQTEPVIWGGQVEIAALAQALNCAITVYSATANPQTMGGGDQRQELRISYHLHYYGLGAHYNSVVPSMGSF